MIKKSVNLIGMTPQIAIAVPIITPILYSHGQMLVITSVADGKHMRQSAHKTGRAMDIRSKLIEDKEHCVGELQAALGPQYDVILEHEGQRNEHIHIEWDPK